MVLDCTSNSIGDIQKQNRLSFKKSPCRLVKHSPRTGTVTLSFTVHRPHYIFVLHERVIDRSITVPRSNTGNDLSAACCQKAMDRLQAR